jgi:hypothetical protein
LLLTCPTSTTNGIRSWSVSTTTPTVLERQVVALYALFQTSLAWHFAITPNLCGRARIANGTELHPFLFLLLLLLLSVVHFPFPLVNLLPLEREKNKSFAEIPIFRPSTRAMF